MRGLTQANVATDLGMSTAAYQKIENGQTSISLSHLLQLRETFNVPISELIGEDRKSFHFENCKNALGHQEGTYYNTPVDIIDFLKERIQKLEIQNEKLVKTLTKTA